MFGEQSEFGLIEKIKRVLEPPTGGVYLGIGDDAAVLEPPRGKMLAAMDIMVEGVHFRRELITPKQLGAKALAVNISDMAAMGGRPLYAMVSLGVPRGYQEGSIQAIYRGMQVMASHYGVQVVGGDTTSSPVLLLDVAVIGETLKPVFRSGAKPGQLVVVSGDLGGSAAGLKWLLANCECLQGCFGDEAISWPTWVPLEARQVVKAHLEPEPQLSLALSMVKADLVSAMQDISDGLASEINHITRASGVGAVIHTGDIPITSATRWAAEELCENAVTWALKGGEDYQLLATVDPDKYPDLENAARAAGTRVTVLGEITADRQVLLERNGEIEPLRPAGFNHFSGIEKPKTQK